MKKDNRTLDERIKDSNDKAIHLFFTILLSMITAGLTTLAWMNVG